ncbi:MAG: metalloregulator ArsR/SmtB family transcription factor [Alphaproteobacteria bacterium]|nr:metalloregulator ArsR/SmtB family transcription factor [Alphaproteobacteria bacterium]
MESSTAIAVLSALGQPSRLAAVRRLLVAWPGTLRAGELAEACGLQPSALSQHLAILAHAGLVHAERAGTTMNYQADAGAVRQLMAFLARDCCGDRRDLLGSLAGMAAKLEDEPAGTPAQRRLQPTFSVLFLGTRNAARSIIAEALLRKMAGTRFTAWSAGTQPARQPMPEVLGRLKRLGCDVGPLRCKPLDTFTARDGPRLDFVFVLGEAPRKAPGGRRGGPDFGDKAIVTAWPLPDPNGYKGTAAERGVLVDELLGMVRRRLETFVNLPFASLDRRTLTRRVTEIGDLAGERRTLAASPVA